MNSKQSSKVIGTFEHGTTDFRILEEIVGYDNMRISKQLD